MKIINKINRGLFALAICAAFSGALAAQTKPAETAVAVAEITNPGIVAPTNDNFADAQLIENSSGEIVGTNVAATKETGEPNHAGNIGGRSVWYKWTAVNPNPIGRTFTLRNADTGFDTVLAIYTGSSVNALTPIVSNDDYGATPTATTSTVFFPTVSGTTYYIAVDGFGGASGNFKLTWDVNRMPARSSFADVARSVSVFRPSTGTWYLSVGAGNQAKQFGQSGDIPAPADYDGDNKTDFAVFRPSNGTFYITGSSNNAFFAVQFGQNGDKPMSGDYNADGYADIAVFRPANGSWYIRGNGGSTQAQQFGSSTDKPVPLDYDGDGKLDIAVFRPSSGIWYITNSYTNTLKTQQWGANGDVPVPGEYSVDGKADIAVWRPSNGTWYTLASNNNAPFIRQWGQAGDIPQPIDYGLSGGLSDLGVFRPSTGTWYIQEYAGGGQNFAVQFGSSGDVPMATTYTVQQ